MPDDNSDASEAQEEYNTDTETEAEPETDENPVRESKVPKASTLESKSTTESAPISPASDFSARTKQDAQVAAASDPEQTAGESGSSSESVTVGDQEGESGYGYSSGKCIWFHGFFFRNRN